MRRMTPPFLLLCLLAAGTAAAVEIQVIAPDGQPLRGARVIIVGRQGSFVTDAGGRFTVKTVPPPPFQLVVSRPDGVALGPVTVPSLPASGPLVVRVGPSVAEAVTVLGAPAPDIDLPPAAAFTLLGREDLVERDPQQLVDAVATVPGTESLGDGHAAVPAIRGMGSARTLILLDDGRVTAERRVGPSATFLDPGTVDEIEVVRGPGSVAYGSDAFGGVIRARTRVPSPGEPATLRYAVFGAAGAPERGADVAVNTTVLGAGLLLAANTRTFDDVSSPEGRVADSGGSFHGFRAGLQGRTLGGNLRVLWRADSGEDIGKPSTDSLTTRTFYPEDTSHRLTVAYDRAGPAGFSRLSVAALWARGRIVTAKDRFATASAPRQLSRATVEADDYGLRVEAERPVGAGRLVVGVDATGRTNLRAVNTTMQFTSSGCPCDAQAEREVSVASARRDDSGVFAALDQAVGAVGLAFGVRGDRVTTSNEGGYFGDRATSRSDASGFLAATVPLGRDVALTVQGARGFRDALLSDRYYRGISGRGFITGNPDLRPETSRQLDAAVRFSRGAARVAVYAYLYRIRDLIERYRDGTDYAFRNRGEAELRGAEVEAGFKVGRAVSLTLGVQAERGEVIGDGAPLDGIPARGVLLTVRQDPWRRGWWFARVAAYARDSRPGPTEAVVPGHAVVDGGIGVRVSPALEVSLTGRNLLDRTYPDSADAAAVPAPGRAVRLTLRGVL